MPTRPPGIIALSAADRAPVSQRIERRQRIDEPVAVAVVGSCVTQILRAAHERGFQLGHRRRWECAGEQRQHARDMRGRQRTAGHGRV